MSELCFEYADVLRIYEKTIYSRNEPYSNGVIGLYLGWEHCVFVNGGRNEWWMHQTKEQEACRW